MSRIQTLSLLPLVLYLNRTYINSGYRFHLTFEPPIAPGKAMDSDGLGHKFEENKSRPSRRLVSMTGRAGVSVSGCPDLGGIDLIPHGSIGSWYIGFKYIFCLTF
jgi:hypothetical protein